jgi:hypothetical protein
MTMLRRVAQFALLALTTMASRAASAQDVTVTPPPVPVPPPPAATPPAEGAPAQPASESPPVVSGFDPDSGFVLRSQDKQWKLRVGIQAAYKFEPVWNEGTNNNRAAFAFLRPLIEGTLFKEWIRFWTSFDWTTNPPYVLDTYIEAQPTDSFGLRGGQFWTPISRHEQFGPQQLLMPDFALVADYFWPGRDKGVMAFGTPAEKKIEYYAGLFSGSPLRTSKSIPGNWEVMARVVANPLGPTGSNEYPYIVPEGKPAAPFRWSIGLNGWVGKIQSGSENFNPSSFKFDFVPSGNVRKLIEGGVDMFVQGSCFAFLAEGYARRTENVDSPNPKYTSIGGFAQLGVMVVPHYMDVAGRVSWLNPSTSLTGDQFWSIEAATSYYIHAPNLIFRLRYGYGHQASPGQAALGDVALPTSIVGSAHVLTVQMNVFF